MYGSFQDILTVYRGTGQKDNQHEALSWTLTKRQLNGLQPDSVNMDTYIRRRYIKKMSLPFLTTETNRRLCWITEICEIYAEKR